MCFCGGCEYNHLRWAFRPRTWTGGDRHSGCACARSVQCLSSARVVAISSLTDVVTGFSIPGPVACVAVVPAVFGALKTDTHVNRKIC